MLIPSSFICPFLVFCLGLCIGSFLNVCIYRLPLGKSIVIPGSSCPKCGHRLRWWENIPILSFLLLRARCSSCGARISIQYPAVELLTGIFSLMLWYKFGLTASLFVYLCFTASLIVVSVIDLKYQIIPDVISLPGIVLGLLSSFLLPRLSWEDSMLGILTGGGSLYLVAWGYELIAQREGMGGGDIKLLAMIGGFLGWQAIPLVIFLSATLGSVIGLLMILVQKKGRYMAIPYGPFLAIAALIFLFWGPDLNVWYLNRIGIRP